MSALGLSRRAVWSALLVGFAALNVWALASAGLDGLLTYLQGLGPIGILATVDLLLALLIGLYLIVRDSRVGRVDPRPYVVLTVTTGSLGLLAYLARHDADQGVREAIVDRSSAAG